MVEERLALLGLLFLEVGAAGEHDVVAVAVELDDLGLDLLTDVRVEVAHPAQLDERSREEAAQADVDYQTALDHFDHRATHRAALVGDLLDAVPGTLVLSPLLGEDEPALFVLLVEDKSLDPLTDLDHLARVDVVADRQFLGGDDPLGLVADVEHRSIAVHGHHSALDDVAFLELEHGVLEGGDEVVGDLIGEVTHVGCHDRCRTGWTRSAFRVLAGACRLGRSRSGLCPASTRQHRPKPQRPRSDRR